MSYGFQDEASFGFSISRRELHALSCQVKTQVKCAPKGRYYVRFPHPDDMQVAKIIMAAIRNYDHEGHGTDAYKECDPRY